jgi:CRP-like cAMP-binding protein
MTDILDPAPCTAPHAGYDGAGFQPAYAAGQAVAHASERNRLYRLADGGWAFSAATLADGRRQIVSFALPGEPVNAAALLGGRVAAPLYALTDVRLEGDAPGGMAEAVAAMLVQTARLADQVLSLGRRTAYERIATFLLQIGERLDAAGGPAGTRYLVPLRLEHLADHLGLSVVHVSRTMRQLRADGLASLYRGEMELGDRAVLRRVRDNGSQRGPGGE